ncbi:MAG TPA: BadF/BadG/BcrA/BcrD ATPase family protein, partial [Trueperaceae bacterium]
MTTNEELLFVGVDGGGTSCRAVVAGASGGPLGQGQAGSANPYAVGVPAAWAAVREAVAAALAAAQLPSASQGRLVACLGLAGVDRPRDRQAFLADGHPFAALHLVNDTHVALVGALGGASGALLVAGTGSIAYAVDAAGHQYRAGGWGLAIGDEGSGAYLGREAVRAAFWAHDGRGPKTELSDALLERWGPTMDDVLEHVRVAKPGDFGQFAPAVLAAAGRGDEIACRLQRQALEHLSALLAALDRRYPPGPLAFALAGSLAAALLPDILQRAPARFRQG